MRWSTTLAFTRTDQRPLRGFLSDVDEAADPNAAGFTQDQSQSDLYFDTHFVPPLLAQAGI